MNLTSQPPPGAYLLLSQLPWEFFLVGLFPRPRAMMIMTLSSFSARRLFVLPKLKPKPCFFFGKEWVLLLYPTP